MDFKQFTEFVGPMTCVLSVEVFPDGTYGNIRIVSGNKSYTDAVEKYSALGAPDVSGIEFVPDSPYELYIPKDLNFEDYCYKCAVLGKPMTAYVKPERYDFWINIIMLPLKSDKENIYYCSYTQEFSKIANTDRMSNLPPEISSTVLSTCIKLHATDNFDKTMNEVIRDIRSMCDAEYGCILLTDFTQRKCSVLCEALGPDSVPFSMKDYLSDDFIDIASTWSDTVAGSNCLIIKDDQDMNVLKERNPIWHKMLTGADGKSMAFFPLISDQELIGALLVTDFDVSRSIRIKQTLELTSYFLASKIANHQLLTNLENMVSVDMLTGLRNRIAMEKRVDALSKLKDETVLTVSIIFADINGLKSINTREGHFTGDIMLKNAAIMLQQCFTDCEIYRAGGDEFMIIAADKSEYEINIRLEQLRSLAAEKEEFGFALGSSTETVHDIRKAMRIADSRMNKDREKFYKKHPELDRRKTGQRG